MSKHNFWPLRLKSITSCQADLPIYAPWQTPCAPLWLFDTSNLGQSVKAELSHAQSYRRIFTQFVSCYYPSPHCHCSVFGSFHLAMLTWKPETRSVQWSLLPQWLAPELHLTGHLFCASWTWAIGEYVTMRYMRFLAKHVRCSYVDFYKLWSESNKCHWFYWDSGLDTTPLLLGFRGFFIYYRAPLKNVSL